VAEKDDVNRGTWDACALSKEPLQPPIVSCQLGLLFNYEAILTALLENTLPTEMNHISSRKDLIKVNFTENPLYKNSPSISRFICPITKLEICGHKHKFMLVKECACVIANSALKEIATYEECPNCSKPLPPLSFSSLFLQLNPPKEILNELRKTLPSKKKKKIKKTNINYLNNNNNTINNNVNHNIVGPLPPNDDDNLDNKIEIKEKKRKKKKLKKITLDQKEKEKTLQVKLIKFQNLLLNPIRSIN